MMTAVSRKDSVIHNSYKCQYLISRHIQTKQSNNYIQFLNSRNIAAKRKETYREISYILYVLRGY